MLYLLNQDFPSFYKLQELDDDNAAAAARALRAAGCRHASSAARRLMRNPAPCAMARIAPARRPRRRC